MRKRSWIRELHVDTLALAADAVAAGSTLDAHWDTLVAYCDQLGLDHVATELASRARNTGASARWWRCHLVLCHELSVDAAFVALRELIHVEAAGEGPHFDVDWHALQVSQTVRFLERHLDRLRAGRATERDLRAATVVVQVARAARHTI